MPAMARPGETGILFEPRDSADIARQLIALLQDPALHARLVEGCKQDVARYSKVAHLERLEAIFKETLALGHKARSNDTDLFAAVHGVLDKAKLVEDWANGMHGHLMHLEAEKKKGLLGRFRR